MEQAMANQAEWRQASACGASNGAAVDPTVGGAERGAALAKREATEHGAVVAKREATGRGTTVSQHGAAAAECDAAELEALVLAADDVPRRVLIAPWGEVNSAVGSFVVDAEGAAAAIAAFVEHGTDIPIDYEHQTLGGAYASPSGQAPAAGWIKALRAVSPDEAANDPDHPTPGLWAEVAWTPMAAEQLRGRQYRYLSPVALVRREDRRLNGLHSAALTNKPAIVGMRPVVNSTAVGIVGADEALAGRETAGGRTLTPALYLEGRGGQASPSATRNGNGVAAGPALGGPDQCVGQAGDVDLVGASDRGAGRAVRLVLGMDESTADDIVLVAAARRIEALESAMALRASRERVDRAASGGKLTAAQREWALALALRDPAEFEAWERSAPTVVALGRTRPPAEGGAAAGRKAAAESSARSQWRANRALLERLCSEEAFVADALRGAE